MSRGIEILLVEDNPGDVRLTLEALRKGKFPCRVSVAHDGSEALERLRNPRPKRPDLVLLDLVLPGQSGFEVLAEVKEDEELRAIPVVVLAASRNDDDVRRAYDLHANCYVSKPVDPDGLMDLLRTLEDFWVTVARLPRGE